MGEFDLIARYFRRPVRHAALGIGDDCALLQPAADSQMAISSDMLVQGRHFFADTDPFKLGHKALAVNLSDLAACAAKPLAFTLALALPQADAAWLAPFSQGLLALADAHGCELIGGDTTQGPLNICITVFGEVPVVSGRCRRCCALAPRLVTTCMSAARSGMPGWRSMRCSAKWRCPLTCWKWHAPGWKCRPPAWRSGWPCAGLPAPPSTSAMACSATSVMFWSALAQGLPWLPTQLQN
jgi:hypothetical protein